MKGIVVGTYFGGPARYQPLDRLLSSLDGCKWPVLIVASHSGDDSIRHRYLDLLERNPWSTAVQGGDGYELGAIQTALRESDFDEFLFLQDSFEIIRQGFLDEVMAYDGPVALGPAAFHYAVKWRREILKQMAFPVIRTKAQSVHYEHRFVNDYLRRDPKPLWVYDPHFHDGEHKGFVQAFGRTNMLLENKHYRKLKGDWGQRPL